MIARRIAVVAAAVFAAPLALAACSTSSASTTLHVLAGSEVADMQPILDDMTRETGVALDFEFMGTLDGTEALVNGSGDSDWQATWFPSNRYLSLFPEADGLVAEETSIMRSPVVLGVDPQVASQLGWTEDQQPTWQQVVDAAGSGGLTYGMTSPVASNSGFTTLVEAATALSGTGSVLAAEDIDAVTPALETFASGQTLAAGSSGWLAEKYAEDTSVAGAIFNYESVLEGLDSDLQIVIPSDGVVTADYPLALLDGASDEERDAYRTVVDYLTQDDVQQRIADETHRRTSATPPEADATIFELPFPAQLQTVQQLLGAWVANVKKPSSMTFAIDTSGSMEGRRTELLREALSTLSGGATGDTASFLRFQPRERITYLEFASETKSSFEIEIPSDSAGYAAALGEIDAQIQSYSATGGTNIYGTLETAYRDAAAGAGDDAISWIVLFTDGEPNGGPDFDHFEAAYEALPGAAGIPVYVILFGEANADEMERVAELTGGRAFDATDDDLAAVFQEIRGYL